jgi:hypothetical protein
MKIHGDQGWETFPSFLDIFIPKALDLLDQLNLKITFFIVGQDAALEKNQEVLRLLVERGHEVGNHSFSHEPWLHRYSKDRIKREVLDAEEQILRVSGQKPVGFRAPGFNWTPELIEVLVENDFLYDASTFPTYLSPLARMYYFWKSNFTKEEKEKRDGLFGSFRDGFKPVKPYWIKLNGTARLLEIPVTTMPIIKLPFHLTYLLYLNRFSPTIMTSYLKAALNLCWTTKTALSFLLHPLDLISGDDVPELAFFPGMDLPSQRKVEIFVSVLKELAQQFTLVSLGTHAQSFLGRNNLKRIAPKS